MHDKNSQVKEFHPRERVLLLDYNLEIFPRKFKSLWACPYFVKEISPHDLIEVVNQKGEIFKDNMRRVKPCAYQEPNQEEDNFFLLDNLDKRSRDREFHPGEKVLEFNYCLELSLGKFKDL